MLQIARRADVPRIGNHEAAAFVERAKSPAFLAAPAGTWVDNFADAGGAEMALCDAGARLRNVGKSLAVIVWNPSVLNVPLKVYAPPSSAV